MKNKIYKGIVSKNDKDELIITPIPDGVNDFLSSYNLSNQNSEELISTLKIGQTVQYYLNDEKTSIIMLSSFNETNDTVAL